MIIGVGVDTVEIDRIGEVVGRQGDRFLARVFTEEELREANGRLDRLAGRFAAKEAVLKVLRTGLAKGISWQDVSISSGEAGEPMVALSGEAEAIAKKMGIEKVHLTITHDSVRAIAFAVGEGK